MVGIWGGLPDLGEAIVDEIVRAGQSSAETSVVAGSAISWWAMGPARIKEWSWGWLSSRSAWALDWAWAVCAVATSFIHKGYRMNLLMLCSVTLVSGLPVQAQTQTQAQAPAARAFIDASGPGWKPMGEADFTNVNCNPDTWTWKDGLVHCTGNPVGVIRTKKAFTNFELVATWRHLQKGGNSGIFVWAVDASLDGLKSGTLPRGGIEVQVLDHGYAEQYQKDTGKPADWFTTHGDVFPVGTSKMKPFAPISPDGSRSFPSKQLSKGLNEWNHYYVRAINGEVRLWVNGEEVSGGTACDPKSGYLCLESEGAPVEFKEIRIRELP